ncbi:MAG: phage tail tube protein [Planctomycetota bacterium]
MAIRLGMEAVLNYKTGGQDGGGSWVELANVRDVTLSLEAGEADVTTRANSGWRAVVATLKEASVEFEMVWDTADAGFGAVKDAYLNNARSACRSSTGRAPVRARGCRPTS